MKLLSLLILCVAVSVVAQPIVPSTPFTREFLRSTNASEARGKIGAYGTNSVVGEEATFGKATITNLSVTSLSNSGPTYFGGDVGFGINPPLEHFDIRATEAIEGSGNKYLLRSTYTLDFPSTSTNEYAPILGQLVIRGTNRHQGTYRALYSYLNHLGSGIVDDVIGVRSVLWNHGGGTLMNAYGFRVDTYNSNTIGNLIGYDMPEVLYSPGTITNIYGVRIQNQPESILGTYAIWTGTNRSYFGGEVNVGGSVTGYRFQVRSSGTNTTPVSIWNSTQTGALFNVREDNNKNAFSQMKDGANSTKVTVHTAGSSFFNGGKVGIGTNTPQATLHVRGSAIVETNLWLGTNAVCPTPLAGGGWLWNSNQALYWVTSTKTNLITDGL